MKNVVWTMVMVGLLAGSASAEIITDGAFANDSTVRVKNALQQSFSDMWVQNHADHWSYNSGADRMERVAGSSASGRAIGQIITLNAGTAVSGYTLDVSLYLGLAE